MKRIKVLLVFFYLAALMFAMANLFPKEDFPIMSHLQVEKWGNPADNLPGKVATQVAASHEDAVASPEKILDL